MGVDKLRGDAGLRLVPASAAEEHHDRPRQETYGGDEGPGISEEDLKKMFGKYMRLSARPTGGESSNGLGLSIVKRLAERMSGTVCCDSRLGQGATFVLELPAAVD